MAYWGFNKVLADPTIDVYDLLHNKNDYNSLNSLDDDNNTIGGYDVNSYQLISDLSAPWQNIAPVISVQDFVGWGTPGISENCMDYAKAQIGKLGYSISNYYQDDGFGISQTFQVYRKGIANPSELKKSISYIGYALGKGIPVIVGVDNKAGSSNPRTDETTDHFVVIVGMGSENGKNYLIYYDNAFGDASLGTHSANKFYYDEINGVMKNTIKSNPPYETSYYGRLLEYDYIMTMVRKSKLKL